MRRRRAESPPDGTGHRLPLWCGRHAASSTLVNHAARRILVALVVLGVAVGGWLMSPRFDQSTGPPGVSITPPPGIPVGPRPPSPPAPDPPTASPQASAQPSSIAPASQAPRPSPAFGASPLP